MKRFYKVVSTRGEQGGFAILLDGKPVKTPLKNPLIAPTRPLAGAIMKEWAGQKEAIVPHEMPLTQILNTKIDRVAAQRAAMEKTLLEYLDTDLLCYPAPHPPELVKLQAEAWAPWRAWFEKKSGAKLLTTTKLEALRQPEEAHAFAKKFAAALDDDHFTVFQLAASLTGSLILAMAFTDRALGPDEIFACARVEERYKAGLYDEKKHGPDPAQEKKDMEILRDLKAAAVWLMGIISHG